MRDRYFGDVDYEVWKIGGDPDAVEPDTVSRYRENDYSPEEAAASIVRRQRQHERTTEEYDE